MAVVYSDPWDVRSKLSVKFDDLIGFDENFNKAPYFFADTPHDQKIAKLREILIEVFRHAMLQYQDPNKQYSHPVTDDLLHEIITDHHEGVMSYDFHETYLRGFPYDLEPGNDPANFLNTESDEFVREIEGLTCAIVRAL
jgi:hypothetical protein